MTTLVTGATGKVGRHVVAELRAAGEDVRAISRSPEAPGLPDDLRVYRADLAHPGSLLEALAGVERLYLYPYAPTADEVVKLARESGVRRVVVLSSRAVSLGTDTDRHLPVEQAVEASGLEYAFIRPNDFAANKTDLWGPMIREDRTVRFPDPDEISNPVHERDIAAVAAAALLADGAPPAVHEVTGPEILTQRRQAELIGEAIGVPVRFEPTPPEETLRLLTAQGGWVAQMAPFLLGLAPYSEGEPIPGFSPEELREIWKPRSTVLDVTGRPPRSFLEWAREHRADFL
ncbi:nucleotide-diphosphate-sugar epimerase [Actinomadura sp. NBRC 104425]|uniref:NAD(P)H-binding protein n=1 Tax=Actinomadura sp. NBRC 104425 TaxID=3032204 RepID=UPI0024A13151|nr:NAD(P)H-binding protein [Actinomadura sp. NBRC 104425]GLZ15448.1 nucleotide-diphosphate-sugar epimerase [Actinomadura sp. NBRC 104425]